MPCARRVALEEPAPAQHLEHHPHAQRHDPVGRQPEVVEPLLVPRGVGEQHAGDQRAPSG